MTGRIKDRNGGTSTRSSNWVGTTAALTPWFPDPEGADSMANGDALTQLIDSGEALSEVTDDYCGQARDDGAYDIGAVEYMEGIACDTTSPGLTSHASGPDAGMGDADSGDAGMGDAGQGDTGQADAGDAGSGSTDAGSTDAGVSTGSDASSDAGTGADATRTSGSGSSSDGCACTSTSGTPDAPGALAWLFGALGLAGALRRRGMPE